MIGTLRVLRSPPVRVGIECPAYLAGQSSFLYRRMLEDIVAWELGDYLFGHQTGYYCGVAADGVAITGVKVAVITKIGISWSA